MNVLNYAIRERPTPEKTRVIIIRTYVCTTTYQVVFSYHSINYTSDCKTCSLTGWCFLRQLPRIHTTYDLIWCQVPGAPGITLRIVWLCCALVPGTSAFDFYFVPWFFSRDYFGFLSQQSAPTKFVPQVSMASTSMMQWRIRTDTGCNDGKKKKTV